MYDDEELPILSSSPMLATAPKKVKSEDERDLPTLIRVQQVLEEETASYESIDRLTVEEKDLTLKEQLAVNKSIKIHLTRLQSMVDTAINDVKEKEV